jgi:hypothetical protein
MIAHTRVRDYQPGPFLLAFICTAIFMFPIVSSFLFRHPMFLKTIGFSLYDANFLLFLFIDEHKFTVEYIQTNNRIAIYFSG